MTRPIHLLEVGIRWPPETFIGWKLEALAERGMRVTVASKSIFDASASRRGVTLMPIPGRGAARRGAGLAAALKLAVTAPRRLVRLLRGIRSTVPRAARSHYGGTSGLLAMCAPLARLSPDIVHFEWHTAAVDYLPLFDVWRCPVVTSCRGSDISVYPHVPGYEHYASALPKVFDRVSAVHCVSASLVGEAAALGLDPAKAVVIRPADDPRMFRLAPRTPREGPLRLVSIGWLRWEKGYEYALEALRALIDRGVAARLEVIGDVPPEWRGRSGERERIEHTARDLGIEAHVELVGEATTAEIAERLPANDVLLHASVTEGLPNAVIEGMACGLPVVATLCGGVSEAVTDGVEGLLVPPRRPDLLADALERIASDRELSSQMGRAGRARFEQNFALEREIGQFAALYRDVA